MFKYNIINWFVGSKLRKINPIVGYAIVKFLQYTILLLSNAEGLQFLSFEFFNASEFVNVVNTFGTIIL